MRQARYLSSAPKRTLDNSGGSFILATHKETTMLLKDMKEGMTIRANTDLGMCGCKGTHMVVHIDEDGDFFTVCASGYHYLSHEDDWPEFDEVKENA
jgi:hypothetical protein